MRRILTSTLTVAGLLSSFASLAENTTIVEHLDWKVYETEHFKVHYTPEYRDWAISSIEDMEQSKALLKVQQNRTLEPKVEVVVFDPYNQSNGYALPFTEKPFMALFTTAPHSDSTLSNSGSWSQLLALHEYVHLLHLGQPQRNPVKQWLGKISDLYDVSDAAFTERWVAEGYATLLESKLTGRGRLFNNQVEAILINFAREGRLPAYHELSPGEGRYLAGSFAYIVGSRYFWWLEQNYGEDKVDALWTRVNAKKSRSFEQAFKGIFAQSPQRLYMRFVAEYTQKALNSETENSDATLWQDLSDTVTSPTLSPAGDKIVMVQQDSEGDVFLRVYSTNANQKAKTEFTTAQEEVLQADPVDIPDTAPEVFPREQLNQLTPENFSGLRNPRWLNDTSILFGASTIDHLGNAHQDLFRWDLQTGKTTQLTQFENLRRFDINANGTAVIAERNRYGKSQLVRLDLNTRAITAITQASIANQYDLPRFRPGDDQQLAVMHKGMNQRWQLELFNLESQTAKRVPAPKGYQFISYPEWDKTGEHLYFAAGLNDQLHLYRYSMATEALHQISDGQQAVGWPMVMDDEQLLYTATNSDGPDIWRLPLNRESWLAVTDLSESREGIAAIEYPHKLPAARLDTSRDVSVERDYGLGEQKTTTILSGHITSSGANLLQAGIKGGDLLQRTDWQINLGGDPVDNALHGLSADLRLQASPLKWQMHAYALQLKPNQQRDEVSQPEQDWQGLYVKAYYPIKYQQFSFAPFAEVSHNQRDIENRGELTQEYFSAGLTQHWFWDKQSFGLQQALHWQWLEGSTELFNGADDHWQGSNGHAKLSGHWQKYQLSLRGDWRSRQDSQGNLLSLGGAPSNLLNPSANRNLIIAPELPFLARDGNKYRYYEVAFGHADSGTKGFYGRHKMTGDVDVYGVKANFDVQLEFTGISDVKLDFGLVKVNPENRDASTEGWMGLWYQF